MERNIRLEHAARRASIHQHHPVRTVAVPGITQFSWWSGGNTNQSPLPIEMLYFKGHWAEGKNLLEWASASETNCDYYTIERSLDGMTYQSLDTISGAGNSLTKKMYAYTDTQPSQGFNYYRIRQTDYNGDYTHSNIVAINVGSLSSLSFTAYPNPSKGQRPKMLIFSTNAQKIRIKVFDYSGQVHFTTTVDAEDEKEISLDIVNFEHFPIGMYFIRAIGDGGEVLLKMIKN